MRTETSWKELQQELANARSLAEFANLEPGDLVAFRREHPDFFPQKWWDYQPTDLQCRPAPRSQWKLTQRRVRDAWLFEFDLDLFDLVHLLTSVFDPDNLRSTILEERYRPPFATGLELGPEDKPPYPFHRAVKWLAGNGWRAKICRFCHRHFVAETSNRKFCSFGDMEAVDGTIGSCFWAHRKKYKKEKWARDSERINARRRQEYQSKIRNRRSRRSKKSSQSRNYRAH